MVSADFLLWPLFAQIGWTFMLYAWLTLARKRAVEHGRIDYAGFVPSVPIPKFAHPCGAL